MADVMLGRILGAPLLQQRQHFLFQFVGIDAFFHDVILMENVAHKVAVIELMHQLAIDIGGKMLKPFGVVTAQGDVQRQNIFHLIGVNRLVADRRTRGGKAVQEGFAAFFCGADEEIPFGILEIFPEPGLSLFDAVARHFQQQMVFVFIAPGFHSLRQVRREDVTQLLHKAVGEVRLKQRHFLQHRVGAALHGKEERHFIGAELVDHQEGVFPVLLGDVVNIAVHILARHRQMVELGENMAANFGQHVRAVGADVEHLLAFFRREGIEAHGKHRQLAGAARGFKQAVRVGVVARRGIGIHVAHAGDVIMIVGMATVVAHILIFNPFVVEAAEDLLRRGAEVNAEVVHQRQLAVFINLRVQRHFGIRRAALYQRAAGVVADPADHRCPDAG